MPITVRPARRGELGRVNELRRMVNGLHVSGRPAHFKPGFGPELQDHLSVQYGQPERFGVIVAAEGAEILGFAVVQYVHRPEGPTRYHWIITTGRSLGWTRSIAAGASPPRWWRT